MPTLAQANSQYHQQHTIAASIAASVRRLFGRQPSGIISAVTSGQLLAAQAATRNVTHWAGAAEPLVLPDAFAGFTGDGVPLDAALSGLIQELTQQVTANTTADLWRLDRAVESLVADAGRSAAGTEIYARPNWTNYVRMVHAPCCDRCAILAGRIYRDNEAFLRHPQCRCQNVPIENWQEAHDEGLVASFDQLFKQGNVTHLSQADAQAIRDGADPSQVINAYRGLNAPGLTAARTVDLFGQHNVKITTAGSWKPSAQHPVRLRPEAIYAYAKNRDDALRLLRLYGYIR